MSIQETLDIGFQPKIHPSQAGIAYVLECRAVESPYMREHVVDAKPADLLATQKA